jgi:hypothetical protein
LNRNGEHIPRGLLRGERANYDKAAFLAVEARRKADDDSRESTGYPLYQYTDLAAFSLTGLVTLTPTLSEGFTLPLTFGGLRAMLIV